MKNVQIPYDLFVALLQYHLMMDDDYEDEIKHGLEQKLEAMVRHEWYAKYKTAPTPEEREEARQRYLDAVSYTHLDVYKRQVQKSGGHISVGSLLT